MADTDEDLHWAYGIDVREHGIPPHAVGGLAIRIEAFETQRASVEDGAYRRAWELALARLTTAFSGRRFGWRQFLFFCAPRSVVDLDAIIRELDELHAGLRWGAVVATIGIPTEKAAWTVAVADITPGRVRVVSH